MITIILEIQPVVAEDPCDPNPCGINAECSQRRGEASCRCILGYFGNPFKECRPECLTNSECPNDKACINKKCQDPCPGLCGLNAQCLVVNHVARCVCDPGFVGDPFNRCQIEATPKPAEITGMAECLSNSECPNDKACITKKCQDPCPELCGLNAHCLVVNHVSRCVCNPGFVGDPFSQCRTDTTPRPEEMTGPCSPSPCGINAECSERRGTGAAFCRCILGYVGNPYVACRAECVTSSECPDDEACQGQKCKSPCPGQCGVHTTCRVTNHLPICSCEPGYTGNPYTSCNPLSTTSGKVESFSSKCSLLFIQLRH